jgi:4-cresol dehydrogenase (hydroxylating)
MLTKAVLPKGIDKKTFATAIKEFRKVVGEKWVKVELDQLAPYARIMVPDPTELHQPSAAVAPASVEEIQTILKIANQYKIPLWTISVGRNFGYGAAAPVTAGQVVLDLKRMNKIIEVDPELGTALIEPGVTFKQLFDYLKENDIPLWVNKPAPAPVVGPMGFTLERGQGYTRYQEQAQHFSGMEVLLADGSLVRTGMGGPENSKVWQCYRWGYGPWVDGLFTQSNFGIVTKLGLWLMKKPKKTMTYIVSLDTLEKANKAIEVVRDLRLDGVIDMGLIFHMSYGVAMTQKRSEFYPGPGSVPDAMWKGVADKLGIPLWSSAGTLYGNDEQIAANANIIKAAFEKIGGKFQFEHEVTGPGIVMMKNMKMLGTDALSLEDFAIFNYRGGGAAWFGPMIPAKAEDADKCYKIIKKNLDEYGFDYMGGYMCGYSGRNFEAATVMLFNKADPVETARAKECQMKIIDETTKAGYPIYRAATPVMDQVAKLFGEGQHNLNMRLKEALDPNHILSPGKSGIH